MLDPTARVTTELSADDISRLIDGLEGTSHLDEGTAETEHTEQLLERLVNLFCQLSQ